MNTNYENMLLGVKDAIGEMVADRLDINRFHINMLSISTDIALEVSYDDEDGTYDTYREITYQTRYFNKENNNFDYGEVTTAYWCHTEDHNGDFSDVVVTEEEFENIINDAEDE